MHAILDITKRAELSQVKQGWFSGVYELTEHIHTFGQIAHLQFLRRKAIATTASSILTFKTERMFGRTILITDQNGELILKTARSLFSSPVTLRMNHHFKEEFFRPSIWSREYVWESSPCGKVMHIWTNPFSSTDLVGIDCSLAPPGVIHLLTFLGSYLIYLIRRTNAAHRYG